MAIERKIEQKISEIVVGRGLDGSIVLEIGPIRLELPPQDAANVAHLILQKVAGVKAEKVSKIIVPQNGLRS